jgi:hypothetical protein
LGGDRFLFFVDIVEQSGTVVIKFARRDRRFCVIERATDSFQLGRFFEFTALQEP